MTHNLFQFHLIFFLYSKSFQWFLCSYYFQFPSSHSLLKIFNQTFNPKILSKLFVLKVIKPYTSLNVMIISQSSSYLKHHFMTIHPSLPRIVLVYVYCSDVISSDLFHSQKYTRLDHKSYSEPNYRYFMYSCSLLPHLNGFQDTMLSLFLISSILFCWLLLSLQFLNFELRRCFYEPLNNLT